MDPTTSYGAVNGNGNQEHTSSISPPAGGKRQRAKRACEPCRLRKRRCDSNQPCNMCVSFDYRCYYEKHPRKRSKIVEASAEQDLDRQPDAFEQPRHEMAPEDRPNSEDVSTLKSMEANSGIAFTGLLGQRLDPAQGKRLFTFGWNVGGGRDEDAEKDDVKGMMDVTHYLNREEMIRLADLYFENVHPLYGFVDRSFVTEQINLRWSPQLSTTKIPDHFFANMAAGGSLFAPATLSNPTTIPTLFEAAKHSLDRTSLVHLPTLLDAQSWLLRSIYLRATFHPHVVHMASCTTLHLVEALGLHQESRSTPNIPSSTTSASRHDTPELRRRTFWIARMLNTWVSFEYGRTRVHLRGINAHLPTPQPGDFTTDYIHLYSLSCTLDPEHTPAASGEGSWDDFLRHLDAYNPPHDAIALSVSNLAMCGYRRLRLSNPNLSPETTTRVIKLGLSGVEAARRMSKKGMPWWHVGNVPFQVVCVFLAMDVRESLARVGEALKVLEEVRGRFGTKALGEAVRTARVLVRLSKKRKDEDSDVLSRSLIKERGDANANANGGAHLPEPKAEDAGMMNEGGGMDVPFEENPTTGSSGDDWSWDVLNNADLDWNFFLTADMPAFEGFVAPDGLM
ncbi:uncharacterized protein LTR77_003821 [Saxophila tyrrhenica]|uniref:Zn(2)-C6 fungal-type domain-containing protein n=1 Tax=Saxophila tyrrhenica TaxID=1690608 RepID=A0AAV9PHE9_9PEZI|nr:hypothetical protein LTR77_003821 [Saxophila tyrrhenica]